MVRIFFTSHIYGWVGLLRRLIAPARRGGSSRLLVAPAERTAYAVSTWPQALQRAHKECGIYLTKCPGGEYAYQALSIVGPNCDLQTAALEAAGGAIFDMYTKGAEDGDAYRDALPQFHLLIPGESLLYVSHPQVAKDITTHTRVRFRVDPSAL